MVEMKTLFYNYNIKCENSELVSVLIELHLILKPENPFFLFLDYK